MKNIFALLVRMLLSFLALALTAMIMTGCGSPKSPTVNIVAAKDSTASADSASASKIPSQPVRLTYEQQQGKVLYTKYCSICHGDAGKGDGFNAYNLDPKPRDFTDPRAMAGIDDANLLATVSQGGKGINKSPLMPAWGGRMDKLQMEYVIAYVKALELKH